MKTIRIGTRGSELALWQARETQRLLAAQGLASELIIIQSEGDQNQYDSLASIGGQGLFTKALDDALLAGRFDLAVHSCKDMPTAATPGIALAAVLERETVAEVLVLREPGLLQPVLEDPAYAARIATGSPRRAAFWRSRYPRHQIEGFRGNVPTRIRKVQEGALDGAIFALAGLKRLGLERHAACELPWMLPPAGQGAIALACREADSELLAALKALDHAETATAVRIERDFLRTLQGGCTAPIASHAWAEGGAVKFRGVVFAADGSSRVDVDTLAPKDLAQGLGLAAAQLALEQGAHLLLGQQ